MYGMAIRCCVASYVRVACLRQLRLLLVLLCTTARHDSVVSTSYIDNVVVKAPERSLLVAAAKRLPARCFWDMRLLRII